MSSSQADLTTRAQKLRAATVAAVLLALFAALGWRLYSIQIADADHWRALAIEQQRPIREIAAYRGPIETADGTVLAGSVRVRSAFAEPRRMGKLVLDAKGRVREQLPVTPADLIECARAIAQALGYDREREERLLERLANPRTAAFCWIERRLDDDRARRLEAAQVRGVSFRGEYRRVYPSGPLAAHVLGFTGLSKDGELYGLTGVEGVFEKQLAGVKGLRESTRDGAGRGLLDEGRIELPPEDGAKVTLTIDGNIQRFCEEAAARAAVEWQPKGMAIVVLRPRDGRILALVSWPGYDPESHAGVAPEALRNRAIQDPFEPGSILKPIIAACALETRAISPTETFDCSSPARFGSRTVRDVHNHGMLPFPEVISNSSNVGMSRIALALGPAGIQEALGLAGFAKKTGLGFPGEEAGFVPPARGWSVYQESISVAQGYAVMATPVQIASALGALGNEGVRMRPQIVERVEDAGGRIVRELQPEPAARLVSPEIARDVMLPAMSRVVEEGTGKRAALEKWTVAGKTGTAMKVVGRGYRAGHYVASFVGLAPAEKPEVIVVVMIDEPTPKGGTPYGGTVSAPVAKEILERTLPYLRVPPSPARAERD